MKYLLFIAILFSLASCSVTNRLNRIAENHPNTFAKKAAKEFPTTVLKDTIVETKTDSADYNALQTYIGEISTIYNKITDSLQKVIDSLPDNTKEDCKPYQSLLDSKNDEIKELRFQIKNVRPIIVEKKSIRYVENTAKIELLNNKIRNQDQQEFKHNEKNKLLETDLDNIKKDLKKEHHQKQKWKLFFWGSWVLFLAAIFLYNKIKKYEKIFENFFSKATKHTQPLFMGALTSLWSCV
ncbi:MAG: hypothetical protein ACEQSR_15165 [Candidatus Methylacidiphilales bacterium]